MAFDDDERSVQDSAPVELYTFDTPSGAFRYVSNYGRVFSFGGNDYDPAVIDRSSIETSPIPADVAEISISIDAQTAFVLSHLVGIPSTGMEVTVSRVQQVSGALMQWWVGGVDNWTIEGRVCRIRSPSLLDDPFQTDIPTVRLQPKCNHVLYDDRCKVNRGDFDQFTSIATAVGRNVTVTGVGGNPDRWFKAGEILLTGNGERRMIVSQIGTSLVIDYPFKSVSPGNACQLFAGCDRQILTCRDKFDNVPNFGGHPYVQKINLFEGFRPFFT